MTIDLNAPEIQEAIKAEAKKQVDAEAGGLKAKNEELLTEVKTLKQKFDGIDPEDYKKLKHAERDAGDKKSDPAELRKRIEEEFTPKLATEKGRGDKAESKLKEYVIDNGLTSALVDVGVSKEFLPAAKALLRESRKVDVTDGGAIVDGKPIAAFAKEWAAGDGKSFIAAPNSSGGGSKGGAGGAPAGGKKASAMSAAEKASFIREHGSKAFLEKSNNEMEAK